MLGSCLPFSPSAPPRNSPSPAPPAWPRQGRVGGEGGGWAKKGGRDVEDSGDGTALSALHPRYDHEDNNNDLSYSKVVVSSDYLVKTFLALPHIFTHRTKYLAAGTLFVPLHMIRKISHKMKWLWA